MPEENLEGMFDDLRHKLGMHTHKVIRSLEASEEEALEWMALRGFGEAAKKAVGVYESKRKLFWAKVELRTQEVTRKLQFNDEKNLIEVVECDHTKKEPENEWDS